MQHAHALKEKCIDLPRGRSIPPSGKRGRRDGHPAKRGRCQEMGSLCDPRESTRTGKPPNVGRLLLFGGRPRNTGVFPWIQGFSWCQGMYFRSSCKGISWYAGYTLAEWYHRGFGYHGALISAAPGRITVYGCLCPIWLKEISRTYVPLCAGGRGYLRTTTTFSSQGGTGYGGSSSLSISGPP